VDWTAGQRVATIGQRVATAGQEVVSAGQRVTTAGHCVTVFGQRVGETTKAPHSVGLATPAQTVACTGQNVFSAGHCVLANAHWVSCRGQEVGTTTAGHTVATLAHVVAFGHLVGSSGQTVTDSGKMVGMMSWSTATIRRMAVVGGGSPGTLTKTTCFP
jgi:hypothetical protein